MKHDFEERRRQRIDRYTNRSIRAHSDAQRAFEHSAAIRHIPAGQPILVGHYSERRHALDKSHNAMVMGLEKKAEYYQARARAAERNTAIFSDDPDAGEKLVEKIERLKKRQELMKAANLFVRKNNVEALLNLGFSESQVSELVKPDFMGRMGFPDYVLTNNSANIRRLEKRLKEIRNLESATTLDITINDIRIVDNVEANRTQIFFPNIPSISVRAALKRSGFRWSPSEGAWQRHLSPTARFLAEKIVK